MSLTCHNFTSSLENPSLCALLYYVSTWPGCDLSLTLQLIVRVRVTVTSSIDVMVLFVTYKPLIELICLKNDGVDLKLYQNKRNWHTYFMYFGNQKKKKKSSRNYISSSFQWETCGQPKTWSTHFRVVNWLVCSEKVSLKNIKLPYWNLAMFSGFYLRYRVKFLCISCYRPRLKTHRADCSF